MNLLPDIGGITKDLREMQEGFRSDLGAVLAELKAIRLLLERQEANR